MHKFVKIAALLVLVSVKPVWAQQNTVNNQIATQNKDQFNDQEAINKLIVYGNLIQNQLGWLNNQVAFIIAANEMSVNLKKESEQKQLNLPKEKSVDRLENLKEQVVQSNLSLLEKAKALKDLSQAQYFDFKRTQNQNLNFQLKNKQISYDEFKNSLQ